jgi:hypothetical protein
MPALSVNLRPPHFIKVAVAGRCNPKIAGNIPSLQMIERGGGKLRR